MLDNSSLVGIVRSALLALLTCLAGCDRYQSEDSHRRPPILHSSFADHMVLQRDRPLRVRGSSRPGDTLTVEIAGVVARATASADGSWQVDIGPFEPGGPHRLSVASGTGSAAIDDVLFGDVWLCSGQSNMARPVSFDTHAELEIPQAHHPDMRLMTVPQRIAFEPQENFEEKVLWQPATPESVQDFSAVCYFFAKRLKPEIGVPIGLIDATWGGTPVEAWTSRSALETLDGFEAPLGRIDAYLEDPDAYEKAYRVALDAWWWDNDPGTTADPPWQESTLIRSDWSEMHLPTRWSDTLLRNFDGVAWFERTFRSPEGAAGREGQLHLGPVDDWDTVWVNGVEVGRTQRWSIPRTYPIPEGVLRAGENSIVVRVLDLRGDGGFSAAPANFRLDVADGDSIGLAGVWFYRTTTPVSELTRAPISLESNPKTPTVLYNGMIAPLADTALKGVLWYQGESNADRAAFYEAWLRSMTTSWRTLFDGELPFVLVQLPNFDAPAGADWAMLREAQRQVALSDPLVGLAATIDIGEANDIHPRNKRDVGTRLALKAAHLVYGRDIVHSGPAVSGIQRDREGIRIEFDNADGGLATSDGLPPDEFSLCAGGYCQPAAARIEGSSVLIELEPESEAEVIRHAWADNPRVNLINAQGLPAVPFVAAISD